MKKADIETPALVIDLDIMERNIASMNQMLGDGPTKLRPHAKSHKTPEIAHYQMRAGAVGITCAKLGEAEAMADGGLKEILVANELVGAKKCQRAAELAKRCNLAIACETIQNAMDLSAAAQAAGSVIGAVIEMDIGNKRCGVRTNEQGVALAKAITAMPGLKFRGVMGYEGQTVFTNPIDERKAEIDRSLAKLVSLADAIRAEGIEVEMVSAGGTGSSMVTGHYPGITDIQAGSYILMDARYGGVEQVQYEQALTLLSTVVSRPLPDLAVLDYGLKSITREFGMPVPAPSKFRDGSPNPWGIDGLEMLGLSEEHARLAMKEPSRDLKVGDKVDIVPSHCCTTMNTHDIVYAVRNDCVEAVWKITGRGKFV
jgi:D-serine deaminase-like pyridoxal phosphate-dependent protein